jgi:hypothetical protein
LKIISKYVVGNINIMPLYDERFIFYGDDKVILHFAMNMMGVRYYVSNDHFIVHLKHEEANWAKKTRKGMHAQNGTKIKSKSNSRNKRKFHIGTQIISDCNSKIEVDDKYCLSYSLIKRSININHKSITRNTVIQIY